MREAAAAALLVVGAITMLLAALGVTRMPDLLTRMQTTAKASTLGVGCAALAAAVYFGELSVTVRAIAVIGFVFLTTPVAAHAIARAGYFAGICLDPRTAPDELGAGVIGRDAPGAREPDEPPASDGGAPPP